MSRHSQMDTDIDLAIAMQLQRAFDEEYTLSQTSQMQTSNIEDVQIMNDSSDKDSMSLVDPRWEVLDPNPDIRSLFLQFNDKYFWGKLAGIEIRWSPRMTSCAGLCVYEGHGGLCSVRLSTPLLKLRPRKDLIETLLHEMIHAYLFVTDNNKDHDGHGPEFHKHMHRLNKECGTKISVYHNFHDEVDHYQQHWWKCNGPCQKRHPFYGLVKRAMNRAPSANDRWWGEHQTTCGGTFTKIKEPENFGKKEKKEKPVKDKTDSKTKPKGTVDIRKMFDKKENDISSNETKSSSQPESGKSDTKNIMATEAKSQSNGNESDHLFPGSGKTLGGNTMSGTSANGPVIRKIPGIGIIGASQPQSTSQASSSNLSRATVGDDNKYRDSQTGKRPLSISDGEHKASTVKRSKTDAETPPSKKSGKLMKFRDNSFKKKKGKCLEEFFKGKEATPPGTVTKVPGFRSTGNHSMWSNKVKKDTTPITNPGEKIIVVKAKSVNGGYHVKRELKSPLVVSSQKPKIDFTLNRNDRAFGTNSDSEDNDVKPTVHKISEPIPSTSGSRGLTVGDDSIGKVECRTPKPMDNDKSLLENSDDDHLQEIDFNKIYKDYREKKAKEADLSDRVSGNIENSSIQPEVRPQQIPQLNSVNQNIGEDAALNAAIAASQKMCAPCPICNAVYPINAINSHLDLCLGM